MRIISPPERDFIQQLADALPFPLRNQLSTDLVHASVEAEEDHGSIIRFAISGYDRPPNRGQHPYPVEARMKDADGALMTVLLHADPNDRLYELEFVKWADEPLISPQWDTVEWIK